MTLTVEGYDACAFDYDSGKFLGSAKIDGVEPESLRVPVVNGTPQAPRDPIHFPLNV